MQPPLLWLLFRWSIFRMETHNRPFQRFMEPPPTLSISNVSFQKQRAARHLRKFVITRCLSSASRVHGLSRSTYRFSFKHGKILVNRKKVFSCEIVWVCFAKWRSLLTQNSPLFVRDYLNLERVIWIVTKRSFLSESQTQPADISTIMICLIWFLFPGFRSQWH